MSAESSGTPRRPPSPDPIDELVRMQKDLVRSWTTLALRSIDRWQSGRLDWTPWFDAYRLLLGGSAEDMLRVLRGLSRR